MTRLRWGIKTAPQHTTYDAMLAVWKEADATPAIEHAWLFDHFAPIFSDVNGPCLEGWTLLAAMLPFVLSLSRRHASGLVFDQQQSLELLMTLGQALLGALFLIAMELVSRRPFPMR